MKPGVDGVMGLERGEGRRGIAEAEKHEDMAAGREEWGSS